ncbi:MAG: hypothetical protein VXY93_15550, partial [Pseudomonadota bacterium]|nr:hypothetical protein [Pseudomonadota bacterium]
GISTFADHIIANKNIGIGTNIPAAPLHISGPDANGARLIIEDNNNNIAATDIRVQNGGRDLRIAAPVDIFFQKLTSSTPVLYLENGNAVGIATDNPSATLDVFGNTILRNDLDVDGHTNLDNVSITGVTTAVGETILNGNVSFYGLNHGAIWRKNNNRFTLNDNAELTFGNNNDTTIKHNNSHLLVTNTTGNIDVTGNVLLNNDLDVDGHTNLDNVSIAGVTTTVGDVVFTGTHYNAFWDESL